MSKAVKSRKRSPRLTSPRHCQCLRRPSQLEMFPAVPSAELRGLFIPAPEDHTQQPEDGIDHPLRDEGHDNEPWIQRRFLHLQPDVASLKRQQLRGFIYGGPWRQNRRLSQENELDWVVHREDSKHFRCELCTLVHSSVLSALRCVKKDLDYKPPGQ